MDCINLFRALSMFIPTLLLCMVSESVKAIQDTIPKRPKIGLVLSGGSAHGLAHIGVIKLIEELEIPIDYIAGTSMGSIVGAMKAMGYSASEIGDIAVNLNWQKIISNKIETSEVAPSEKQFHNIFPFSFVVSNRGVKLPIGAVDSHNLDALLTRLYSPAYAINDFDSLPIPFACNTTDIAKCENIELNSGSLSHALRRSMSIPSFFSPVREGEKLYVDGGVTNNFPVQQVKKMGADIIIGSYVGAQMKDADHLKTMTDILKQIGFFQSLQDFKNQQGSLDILIKPNVKMVSSFNFEMDDFFIDKGYEAANEYRAALIQLRDSFNLRPNSIQKLEAFDSIRIDNLDIIGLEKSSKDFISSKLDINLGDIASLDDLEENISLAYGTKSFEALKYSLHKDKNDKNTLRIVGNQVKKADLGITVNRFKSSGLSIILGLNLKDYIIDLADVHIHARLSEFPGIWGRFAKRATGSFSNFVFGLDSKAEMRFAPLYWEGSKREENNVIDVFGKAFILYEFNRKWSFVLRYNAQYQKFGNRIKSKGSPYEYNAMFYGTESELEYNSFDNIVLPSRGIQFRARVDWINYLKYNFINNDSLTTKLKNQFSFQVNHRHAVPLGSNVNIIYNLAAKIDLSLVSTPTVIGGNFQNKDLTLPFIGLKPFSVYSSNYLYNNIELRLKLFKNFYLTPTFSYIASLEIENSIIGVGISTTYLSPLGPITLSLGSDIDNWELVPNLTIGQRFIY